MNPIPRGIRLERSAMRLPRLPQEGSDRRTYVYAIQCGDYVKVGITLDLERRLSDVRLLNPHPAHVAMYRTVSRNNAVSVEARMHQLLAQWHHDREWFTAPLDEVRKAAKVAIAEAERIERIELAAQKISDEIGDEAVARAMARGPCRPTEFERERKRVISERRRAARSPAPLE